MDPNTDNDAVPVRCVVVAAPRADLRDECCWAILRDVPSARTVRYDVVTLPSGRGFRRTISESGCVVEQHEVDITTHCMTCAIRIDLLITLDRLRRSGSSPVIVGLPVGTNVSSVVWRAVASYSKMLPRTTGSLWLGPAATIGTTAPSSS